MAQPLAHATALMDVLSQPFPHAMAQPMKISKTLGSGKRKSQQSGPQLWTTRGTLRKGICAFLREGPQAKTIEVMANKEHTKDAAAACTAPELGSSARVLVDVSFASHQSVLVAVVARKLVDVSFASHQRVLVTVAVALAQTGPEPMKPSSAE